MEQALPLEKSFVPQFGICPEYASVQVGVNPVICWKLLREIAVVVELRRRGRRMEREEIMLDNCLCPSRANFRRVDFQICRRSAARLLMG